MRSLRNGELAIDLLEPSSDHELLGPRFCWGGFIWQVYDATTGPVLTGPEWPSPTPDPFNGQGLPESFRHRTREGRPLTWNGTRGVAIGIGTLSLSNDGSVHVDQPCTWEITAFRDRAVFHTHQAAFGFNYELVRMVELTGRDLLSVTKLTNRGTAPLVLEWFVHPFFALADGMIAATLPAGTELAENPGFALEKGVLRNRRRFAGRDDGHFDRVTLPGRQPLQTRLSHPRLTHIEFSTSFIPTECVIWANGHTFSIEPYLAIDLAPGETRQWSLSYRFGGPTHVAVEPGPPADW
ncbi:MAG TPA: hypothetical protein VGD81_15295 [Opitutaceae bacterium]